MGVGNGLRTCTYTTTTHTTGVLVRDGPPQLFRGLGDGLLALTLDHTTVLQILVPVTLDLATEIHVHCNVHHIYCIQTSSSKIMTYMYIHVHVYCIVKPEQSVKKKAEWDSSLRSSVCWAGTLKSSSVMYICVHIDCYMQFTCTL